MNIENICALEKIKKLEDNSQDIIYADPPYALGSTVLINEFGKPFYKEARDFMSKWEMPDEKFWEEFFKEANRVLKYGGRVLFFGIDRQLFLFQYYAVASGLEIKQSLYWLFLSNFPKSTDLSKQVDKRLGAEREVVGEVKQRANSKSSVSPLNASSGDTELLTKSSSDLGKKYEGFKYSISPLKQVLETVMVFQKPTKNKSVLDDVFAYEDGDETISPSIWGIDGGRVPTSDKWDGRETKGTSGVTDFDSLNSSNSSSHDLGRFPSQLFIDKECASKIDEQSGELTSGTRKNRVSDGFNKNSYSQGMGIKKGDSNGEYGDSGGTSRILHHIEYLDEELDLGKKYEGFKYSISPLKQVLETVMVFQKPTKNKSVLDDVFAYEDGDETISPSIWNIHEGRVGTTGARFNGRNVDSDIYGKMGTSKPKEVYDYGRFPSQLFIDKECVSKIDEQSGELTSGARKSSYARRGCNPNETYGKFNEIMMDDAEKDSGGASRILHHIEYLDEELGLVIYSPKVSTFEREVGCDDICLKEKVFNGTSGESSKDIKGVEEKFTTAPTKNSHPTLKPIKLNYQIFKLLKTPNPQNVFFPFSGAGSEIIGAIQAGFDSDLFECSEISEEFVAIAEARVKAWENLDINDLESSKKHIEKLSKEDPRQGSLF